MKNETANEETYPRVKPYCIFILESLMAKLEIDRILGSRQ
ncbi:hypothetical protein SPWS13_4157 [Shewanella putrefaciens]|nr:hypothetical protein SPWS13_4157 [Shewanella putrefaciens]